MDSAARETWARLGSRRGIVRGDRSKVGHVDAMRGWVHDERMPAKMCRGILENMVLIGGILLNDGHRADAVCCVDAAQDGIVARAIDSRADGELRRSRPFQYPSRSAFCCLWS